MNIRMAVLNLRTKIYSSKLYWRVRSYISKSGFQISNLVLKAKLRFGDLSTDSSILRQLISTSFGNILISAAAALAILILSSWIASRQGPLISFSLQPILALFGSIPSQNNASYDGFLVAVITVIGVVLTLYITNIGNVAGTIYARFPGKIRDLFLRERVGNLYIKYLISLTLLCLVFLLGAVIWAARPQIVLIIVVLLSLLAIGAFGLLGFRSFQLFDPTFLSPMVYREFIRWVGYATALGFKWTNKSFQTFFHQQAEEALDSIAVFVDLCWDEQYLKGKPLLNILRDISTVARQYLVLKMLIPTGSNWFTQKPSYDFWYLSPYHTVEMATRTQTDLHPKTESDSRWVKSRLIALERNAISKLLSDHRFLDVIQVLSDTSAILSNLSNQWDLGYACNEFEAIAKSIKALPAILIENAKITEPPSTLTEKIAIYEYSGIMLIDLFLSLYKKIASLNPEKISEDLTHLDWIDPASIYKMGLPIPMLEKLEYLSNRISFEMNAEGKLATPNWYIRQEVFELMAEVIQTQLETILTEADHVHAIAKEQIEEKNYYYSVVLVIRTLEFYEKFFALAPAIKKFWDKLGEAYIEKSRPWSEDKWQALINSGHHSQSELFYTYAKLIPLLLGIEKRDEIPDFSGRAVHVIGERCFQSLMENDIDLFKRIFPYYFYGALFKSDVLRQKTNNWRPELSVLAISGPIIDLCYFKWIRVLLFGISR